MTAPAPTALETLIARYESLDSHVASDGYNDRDAEAVIDAAREERREMVEVLWAFYRKDWSTVSYTDAVALVARYEALLAKHKEPASPRPE